MLILLLIALLLFIQWWRMKPFYWKNKNVPCNVPLPIFGSMIESFHTPFHTYWNKQYLLYGKFGGMYGMHNFHRVGLMVSEPDYINDILINQFENFNHRGVHTNPSYDVVARSSFFASGEEWKRTRSKITFFFTPSRLKNSIQMMSVNMKEYTDEIDKLANNKESGDFNGLSLKLTTDIVVNTIFGVEPDSFKNPNSYFYRMSQEIFGYSFVLKILLGTVAPFIYDLFKITIIPSTTLMKLKGFVEGVFEQRKQNIGVRQDFIQSLIELTEKESVSPNSTKSGFTMSDATAQCAVMYMAGTETTGNSLSYLLHELAYHQDIQDKIRDEINYTLAQTNAEKFSYDLLAKLTYTNMALNETLRKYPIVPLLTRECIKSTRVGNVDIETGTSIFIPIMGLHHDPKFYPEPEKFIPERFSTDGSEYKAENAIFMPFGLGPKTCIGWKMALLEMAYALSEILPKYKIYPSSKSSEEVKFSWKPTLNPDNGIWLSVQKI